MGGDRNSRGQGIGARLRRKEDARHLYGRGNFVADMSMPGLMEVAFVRSPVAHGRILGVSVPEGRQGDVFDAGHLSEVKPIRTTSTLPGYKVSDYPPLAAGKVRFVGEAVAMCVAPSRAEAEDIGQEVGLDIEELPPLVDVFEARREGAPLVHESWGDNLFLETFTDADVESVAATAPVAVHRRIRIPRQCQVPMEGKGVLAYWDHRADQLVVYSSTQIPHMVRTGLSQCLGIEHRRLRVVSPDVGGGFGYKVVLQPEELCIAWLAMTRKRPFRWTEDRREHLVAGANTRQHHYDIKAYADRRGRLLALDAEVSIDVGAYSVWPFTACLEAGQVAGNLPGPYAFDVYRCRTLSVATNKPPFTPYRGVARPGVCFAIELMIDAIAREVGREPWEVRMENLVPPEAMPFDNVSHKHFDSGDYPESLRRVVEDIDPAAVRARQQRGEEDGRRIGVGFATYTEQTAHGTKVFAAWGLPVVPGYEQATVRLTPDGGLEVRAGVHSHGQGMETTLAQIATEVLGIPPSAVNVVLGDTALTPYSTGTYASRGIVMAGGAVSRSCEVLGGRILAIAAHLLQCEVDGLELVDGGVRGAGGQAVSFEEVARAWYLRPEQLPDDVATAGLEVTEGFRPEVDTGVFTYASHGAVVAVDTETGNVEILDYVIVEDCGTRVNPMIVEGQTRGGAAQGVGTALYEEVPYDEAGQPLVSTLMDYLLPGACEVPAFRIHYMETPSPYTRHGIKGMGEGGPIAPPAVLANAINDALGGLGVEISESPMTPRRLLAAILDAEGRRDRSPEQTS